MKTVVLGLGNPIVTDDGVGIEVARRIGEQKPHVEVVETSEAGLALLDYVAECDRLVIIDSIKTGKGRPGEVYKLEMDDLRATMDQCCSHGVDLASALEVGRGLGYRMPGSVAIYAVEVKDNSTFGEGCTDEVRERVPFIASEIAREEKL